MNEMGPSQLTIGKSNARLEMAAHKRCVGI